MDESATDDQQQISNRRSAVDQQQQTSSSRPATDDQLQMFNHGRSFILHPLLLLQLLPNVVVMTRRSSISQHQQLQFWPSAALGDSSRLLVWTWTILTKASSRPLSLSSRVSLCQTLFRSSAQGWGSISLFSMLRGVGVGGDLMPNASLPDCRAILSLLICYLQQPI